MIPNPNSDSLSCLPLLYTLYSSDFFALLSQSEEQHYVRLEFGPAKEVHVVQFNSNHNDQDQHHQTPTSDNSNTTAESKQYIPVTRLAIPRQPVAVHLLHSMAQCLLLVDDGQCRRIEGFALFGLFYYLEVYSVWSFTSLQFHFLALPERRPILKTHTFNRGTLFI